MTDPRELPIEIVGAWADGTPVTAEERKNLRLLRVAGCDCPWPLLGRRPDVGPRCRMCNTEGKEAAPGRSFLRGRRHPRFRIRWPI